MRFALREERRGGVYGGTSKDEKRRGKEGDTANTDEEYEGGRREGRKEVWEEKLIKRIS